MTQIPRLDVRICTPEERDAWAQHDDVETPNMFYDPRVPAAVIVDLFTIDILVHETLHHVLHHVVGEHANIQLDHLPIDHDPVAWVTHWDTNLATFTREEEQELRDHHQGATA